MKLARKSKKPGWVFWLSWSSSRYDRPNQAFREALEFYITKSILHGGTEVTSKKRKSILAQVMEENKWGLLYGHRSYRDDTYLAWSRDFFDAKHQKTVPVKTGKLFTGKGNRMPDNACTIALLVFKPTGTRLLVSALHPPSGSEGPKGLKERSGRANSWMIEHRDWKKIRNEYYKEWDADAMLALEDSNVNMWRSVFHGIYKSIQPGMKMIPISKKMKGRGTHHWRWIDIGWFRGRIRVQEKARLMRDDDSSDHAPWKAKMRILRPKKK